MKENKSKYAIMGMLSMGPMSGYDIKKRFEKSLSYFWNESYGQIYPILRKLAVVAPNSPATVTSPKTPAISAASIQTATAILIIFIVAYPMLFRFW